MCKKTRTSRNMCFPVRYTETLFLEQKGKFLRSPSCFLAAPLLGILFLNKTNLSLLTLCRKRVKIVLKCVWSNLESRRNKKMVGLLWEK